MHQVTRHDHGKYHRHSQQPVLRHTLNSDLGPQRAGGRPAHTTSLGRGATILTQVADPAPRLDVTTRRASVKKNRTKASRQHRAEKVTVNWEESCATREDLGPTLFEGQLKV